jgi:DNA ligase-1
MLGGFIVDYKGKEVRVGSGFSDAERHDLWFSKHSQIGNIIEVKYHEVTPDGSLRHPVFGGFRYDK